MHATFAYEQKTWFLRDNNSTNGVWLNGVRLQPGVNYQLNIGDVIDLAHVEKVIFFKEKKTNETQSKPVKTDWAGTVISGRYQIDRLIGRGGVSYIFQGVDLRIGRICTIKIVNKLSVPKVVLDMLLQEVTLQSYIVHQGVPQIYDLLDMEDAIIIVREYIEGKSLEELIRETEGPLQEKMVIDYALQVAAILKYLHTMEPAIIHRDIKPHNMMLTSKGQIKLIDFGTAKRYNPDEKQDATVLGTRGYAPPEQYVGKTDERTDIYALGITMFYMLTKEKPGEVSFEVHPVCDINSLVSKGLEYIINKCTERLPQNRYQTVDDLIYDLKQCSELPKHNGSFFKR